VSEVEYRRFRPGDEIAINEGFNRVFGTARTLEEWQWRFPPEGEGRWIYVAVGGDGRMLAHYGAQAVAVTIDGLRLRAGQIVDAYSVPEVRGTRVFSTCYERFIDAFGNPHDLPLMYGFPGRRHYEMGLKSLKYIPLGEVPYWRKAPRRSVLPPVRFRIRAEFDRASVEALWLRARQRTPVAFVRSPERLAHRYTGRPGVEYFHLSCWRNGEAAAWGVARAADGCLRVADLLWDGRDPRAVHVLDRGFDSLARRLGCGHLEMWLRGDRELEGVLTDAGWVRQPNPLDLLLVGRAFHPELDLDVLASRLYLTMGDSDLV
jgi:hypothetical protein